MKKMKGGAITRMLIVLILLSIVFGSFYGFQNSLNSNADSDLFDVYNYSIGRYNTTNQTVGDVKTQVTEGQEPNNIFEQAWNFLNAIFIAGYNGTQLLLNTIATGTDSVGILANYLGLPDYVMSGVILIITIIILMAFISAVLKRRI